MHLAEVKQTQKMQERGGREVRREDDNLGAGEHKGTKRGLGRGSNRSTKQTLEGRRELKQGLNEKLEVQKVEQQKVQAEEQA